MQNAQLNGGEIADFLALGQDGQPVYLNAEAFISALSMTKAIGQDKIRSLAIPRLSANGEHIDWYIPFAPLNADGKYRIVSWGAATAEERLKALGQLRDFEMALKRVGANLNTQGASKSSKLFAHYLCGTEASQSLPAIHFPSPDYVFIVDDIPVITFWGFTKRNHNFQNSPFTVLRQAPAAPKAAPQPPKAPLGGAAAPAMGMASQAQAAAPQPEPAPKPQAQQRRPFPWMWIVAILLLLLLLALGWYLWQHFMRDPAIPVGNTAAVTTPVAAQQPASDDYLKEPAHDKTAQEEPVKTEPAAQEEYVHDPVREPVAKDENVREPVREPVKKDEYVLQPEPAQSAFPETVNHPQQAQPVKTEPAPEAEHHWYDVFASNAKDEAVSENKPEPQGRPEEELGLHVEQPKDPARKSETTITLPALPSVDLPSLPDVDLPKFPELSSISVPLKGLDLNANGKLDEGDIKLDLPFDVSLPHLDLNTDGLLSPDEIKAAGSDLVDRFLGIADINKDGVINAKDFKFAGIAPEALGKADLDKDGVLDASEIEKLTGVTLPPPPEVNMDAVHDQLALEENETSGENENGDEAVPPVALDPFPAEQAKNPEVSHGAELMDNTAGIELTPTVEQPKPVQALDSNGNGVFDEHDVQVALPQDLVLPGVDTNNDGLVTREELQQAGLGNKLAGFSDVNRDGVIDAKDVKYAGFAPEALKLADVNNDNVLDAHELSQLTGTSVPDTAPVAQKPLTPAEEEQGRKGYVNNDKIKLGIDSQQLMPARPAAPQKPLSFTQQELKAQGSRLLDGSWSSRSALMDSTNGQPLHLSFDFKNAQGEIAVTRYNGSRCATQAAVQRSAVGLVILPSGKARCADGTAYQIPEIACQTAAEGRVRCFGKAQGQKFPITLYAQ